MTFEALATVISALNLLEAGKIGVCGYVGGYDFAFLSFIWSKIIPHCSYFFSRFGESVQVVHGLGDPWSNEMGAAMLAQFDFKQTRTSLTEVSAVLSPYSTTL